jgi:hypothetical protein
MFDHTSGATALTSRQLVTLAAMGASLWLVAALLIRVLGPMDVYEGSNRIWLYLLVIPGTLPFVPLVRRSAGLAPGQHFIAMAVATAVAALLDGVALAWFPWLYADTIERVAAAGAVILWGAGVGMALGLLVDRHNANRRVVSAGSR